MVVFQTELLKVIEPEIRGLLKGHWEEVALNKDAIKLEPDWPTYHMLEESGKLHILTARDDGTLIGYYLSIIHTHLHYASAKHAVSDIYYLLPPYRRGRTALRLFQENEKAMLGLGVKKLVVSHKVHLDIGPLLEKLGYAHIENVHAKLLGE